MVACPHCNKEINVLVHLSEGICKMSEVVSFSSTSNGISYSDFEVDEIISERNDSFVCPSCYDAICDSIEDAEKFLNTTEW